jgi:hypothetical protein
MRFLLRRIATGLRVLSLFPMGNPRTITLWRFLNIRKALLRVSLLSLAASIVLAIWGVGLHLIIDQFLLPPITDSSSLKPVAILVASCSAWVFMVSINHIHDVMSLIGQIDHYYELLWMVPAFIGAALIGPVYDLCFFIIHIPSGNAIAFTDLIIWRELASFFVDTIPAFSTYLWKGLRDWLSSLITLQDCREFRDLIYQVVTDSVTKVIGWLMPDWLSDTRIGKAFIGSIASSLVVAIIVKVILHFIL